MIQKTIHLFFLLGLVSKTFCYFILIQEPKNWTEAQSFCKKFHLDLATVQSDQDRSKIKEIANSTSFHKAWMGLYDGVCEWRWSFQDKDLVFKNWGSMKDSITQRMCGVIKMDGTWYAAPCDQQKTFFCYNGNRIGGKFIFFKTKLTWRDAQYHCRKNYIDLAIISDYSDNTYLVGLLNNYFYFGSEGWIGLSKNLWLWSDQSKLSWLSLEWASGEPDNGDGNEKCAFVNETGLIGDKGCLHELPFFCTERRNMQLVRVAVKSAGHLNESAVMTAVEEKIHQILTEQKMDAGSNLRWTVQPDGTVFQQQENDTRDTTAEEMCEERFPPALLPKYN